MLFLFSDVTQHDAPTRIRLGSHLSVARLLAPMGDDGLSMLKLARLADAETSGMPEVLATGAAGTVYLGHPFLVHAAQPHRGTTPRFMGQPPLCSRAPLEFERTDGAYSLVETAIRLARRMSHDRHSAALPLNASAALSRQKPTGGVRASPRNLPSQ